MPRPVDGDIVALILADHRLFEDLLQLLRDRRQDRAGLRKVLADLLAAHAEAEERQVYPTLVRSRAVDVDEVVHSREEHLDGNERLLALLEVPEVDSVAFDDAVEELAQALTHHMGEEEREILEPARTGVSAEIRGDLGRRFAAVRNERLDAGAGDPESVRELIERERQQAHRRT